MSLSVLLQRASVRSYSQAPKLQYFVKIDSFTIKILPLPNLTTANSLVMSVYYQRILIESYSKIIEIMDFIKNSLPRESDFSVFKRQIRKNKNPGALIQVIAVKMTVVSSKSVYCSTCATVPKFFISQSLISRLKLIRALWSADNCSDPFWGVRCSIKKNGIDFRSSGQNLQVF